MPFAKRYDKRTGQTIVFDTITGQVVKVEGEARAREEPRQEYTPLTSAPGKGRLRATKDRSVQCNALNRFGLPCGAYAVAGGLPGRCLWHQEGRFDPVATGRKGGIASGKARRLKALEQASLEDVMLNRAWQQYTRVKKNRRTR